MSNEIEVLEERLSAIESEKLEIIDKIRLINKDDLYNRLSAAVNNIKNKYKDKLTIVYAYAYDYCPYKDYLGSYRYKVFYTIHDKKICDEILSYIAEAFCSHKDYSWFIGISLSEKTSYDCSDYSPAPDKINVITKDQRDLPEMYDGYYVINNDYRNEIWYKDGFIHYLVNNGRVWSEI